MLCSRTGHSSEAANSSVAATGQLETAAATYIRDSPIGASNDPDRATPNPIIREGAS
jgi:hypothetical protein